MSTQAETTVLVVEDEDSFVEALSIVRHVLTNHGGEVTVSSREGEGSVFTLRLPTGPGLVAVPEAG